VPKPIVAIVGRPNVGKSTLFNRLVGERVAIVEDLPGTTRDRIYGDAEWGGREFVLVDTGGLEPAPPTVLARQIGEQVASAVEEADVVVFLVDARDGITSADLEIAEFLRQTNKPVILAANKADNVSRRQSAVEFYELGLGEVIPISAVHGIGTGDLLDAIVDALPPLAMTEDVRIADVGIAIVGRPNVGKSSLLNKILGYERTIVSEIPGTTRDAIDTIIEHGDQTILLIDTAGMRRRGRIIPGIEKYSVLRALRAIDRSDVVLLVVDAVEGITAQDSHLAGYVEESGKGLVVVVNKWDLVQKTSHTTAEYIAAIREALKFFPDVPIAFISAKTGLRVTKVLDEALKVATERRRRISTGQLNEAINKATSAHAPPTVRGRRLKIYYVTQAEVEPPTFVFFVNDPKLLHWSYQRYLENQLRALFGFPGTPLRLVFRSREESARERGR
jgi:GTP-binding protein